MSTGGPVVGLRAVLRRLRMAWGEEDFSTLTRTTVDHSSLWEKGHIRCQWIIIRVHPIRAIRRLPICCRSNRHRRRSLRSASTRHRLSVECRETRWCRHPSRTHLRQTRPECLPPVEKCLACNLGRVVVLVPNFFMLTHTLRQETSSDNYHGHGTENPDNHEGIFKAVWIFKHQKYSKN